MNWYYNEAISHYIASIISQPLCKQFLKRHSH